MYKIPKIPIFPELLGAEKRIQTLQQKIAELDWLEFSFGLAKRLNTSDEDPQAYPGVYTGVRSDSLDMRMWPADIYKAYAFWDLTDTDEFEYFDNRGGRHRFPKILQPVALIVCLDNKKISQEQDYNVTFSICKNELINKLNRSGLPGGTFEITGIIENKPVDVFLDYDVSDDLMDPDACLRIDGLITYTQDCT